MSNAWKIIVGLPGIAFVCVGLLWLLAPGVAGAQFEMALLSGMGLSTQIADLASFFLTLGTCILVALATGNRLWFAPAVMLLGFAMCGRFIAWFFYGADLALSMMAVEFIMITLILIASQNSKPLQLR